MKLLSVIRKIVLLTNPHWPFNLVNKLPYKFAILQFIQFSRQFPEIHALYLRHGMVYENWQPGLSDIDLTVVIKDEQEWDSEFHFLLAFWQKFQRIRKWLPMLTDVNILSLRQMKAWTGFTISGYEARDWQKIFGKECPREADTGFPADRFRDALNHAFVVYQWILLPLFHHPIDKGSLARLRLLRIANKIIRYGIRYQNSDQVNTLFCHDSMDDIAMIANTLYNLERYVVQFSSKNNPGTSASTDLFPPWHELDEEFSNSQITSSLQEILPFLVSIYRESGRDFVILQADLTLAELEHTVRILKHSATAGLHSQVILTMPMFKYALAYYCPDLYASLRWKRNLLWGKDSVYHLPAPSLKSFTWQLLDSMGKALNFAQSEAFFTIKGRDVNLCDDLVRAVAQLLKLRLYFDKGIVRIYKRQWHEELAKYYPVDFTNLAHIKERAQIDSLQDRMYCYKVIRNHSDMVCRLFEHVAHSTNHELFTWYSIS
ncbi:MAG TPA: hypothetical protein PKN04_11300 [bacterium]|nr:hypothetical protein [bacterium]HNT66357.1 hypothetical protein [bacterium]HPG47140.1 hypothetical protein [bacterium]